MNLRPLVLPFALALAAPAFAGGVQRQSRPLSGFDHVKLEGAANVHVRHGAFAVTVSAPAEELADYETRVESGTLVIDTRGDDHHGEVEITIAMPEFHGLTLGGAGDVDVSGFDRASEVEFVLTGAGNVDYSGATQALKLDLRGTGNVKLVGSTEKLEVHLGGVGHVKANDFPAHDADVSVTGTGGVDFTANGGGVNLALDGIGAISWHGDAKVLSESSNGLGHISHG
jgi:hypothetical protein